MSMKQSLLANHLLVAIGFRATFKWNYTVTSDEISS